MKKIVALLVILVVFASCENGASKEESSKELNVYTHRHYESDQEIFKLFEDETGIKVNVINASADELIQKMVLEGPQSPADVLITVDAGRLHRAKEKDLLQSITSSMLDSVVPAYLKDEDNQWFALTKRARVIAYDKERVDSSELSSYENLVDEKWNGRLLLRSSSNIYNQSLMASIVANDGEDEARLWAKAMVDNMARSPKGNDRDQVKAVASGEGDLAIVNTYYIGKMLVSNDKTELEAGQKVGIFFPNQEDRGTHINVSGAGVAKYAPNKANAIQFIEFLLSEKAQEVFASSNFEYPVNANVAMAELLKEWGDFKEDTLPLNKLGELNKRAVILFDEAGWK